MFDKKYAEYYDLFNSDKPYKQEIEFVYEWAGRPETIFDIGCGNANYWGHYPKGTVLVGIDKSCDMARGHPNIIVGDITKYKHRGDLVDCATALFDVLNYIPFLDWFKRIPVRQGGFFIFDVWTAEKVFNDGFRETVKEVNGATRRIKPFWWGHMVDLEIEVTNGEKPFTETHTMFIHSHEEILKACGKEFEVIEVKPTERWQTWWKLRRKCI